jgi:hypothetical protein
VFQFFLHREEREGHRGKVQPRINTNGHGLKRLKFKGQSSKLSSPEKTSGGCFIFFHHEGRGERRGCEKWESLVVDKFFGVGIIMGLFFINVLWKSGEGYAKKKE